MKRKILIVNPASLFPTFAMNQVRTLHMAKNLKKYFEVEIATPVTSEKELEKSIAGFKTMDITFYPLHSKKHKSNIFKKRYHQVIERINYYLLGIDKDFIAGNLYKSSILHIINKNHYAYVISNYWEISGFFRQIHDNTIKILDTHYAVKENLEVFEKNGYKSGRSFFKGRELKRSLEIEKSIAQVSDIIISLSSKCFSIFNSDFPSKRHLMIADGNDLDYYSESTNLPEGNTIVFYGSMSSEQNKGAFWRAFNNILPIVKQQVADVKMVVIGNKPPQDIQNLHNGKDMIVTGYVDDVRPWLSKGKLLILPLEIGSGFRGRIVEVMAMGLPVVGTHNALDSLDMESGVQGFVSDSDYEMADYCIRLMLDEPFRQKHSLACKNFVSENYSLDATFGKLSEFLLSN